MDQETIIQQEGLGEVINRVKDLITRVDTQIGCAAREEYGGGSQTDELACASNQLFGK